MNSSKILIRLTGVLQADDGSMRLHFLTAGRVKIKRAKRPDIDPGGNPGKRYRPCRSVLAVRMPMRPTPDSISKGSKNTGAPAAASPEPVTFPTSAAAVLDKITLISNGLPALKKNSFHPPAAENEE